MANKNLEVELGRHSRTHFQVEAVTRNVVDAAIEVGNESNDLVMLRLRPHQIGSGPTRPGELGFAGIHDFVDYIGRKDVLGKVGIGRCGFAEEIHGCNSLSDAKMLLRRDLDCGIDFFHIDASLVGRRKRSLNDRRELELNLLRFVCEQASARSIQPVLEIGGPGAFRNAGDISAFSDYLDDIIEVCEKEGLTAPRFACAQTGTTVRELTNTASLLQTFSFDDEMTIDTKIAESADLASFRGIGLIAHDCDYMDSTYLRQLFAQNIMVASFGEELGTHETQVFLQLCDATRAASIRQDFLQAAWASRLWEKKLGVGSSASELEKAILAAHHLLEHPVFQAIKLRLEKRCGAAGLSLDQTIREAHKTRMLTIMRNLGSKVEMAAATL